MDLLANGDLPLPPLAASTPRGRWLEPIGSRQARCSQPTPLLLSHLTLPQSNLAERAFLTSLALIQPKLARRLNETAALLSCQFARNLARHRDSPTGSTLLSGDGAHRFIEPT